MSETERGLAGDVGVDWAHGWHGNGLSAESRLTSLVAFSVRRESARSNPDAVTRCRDSRLADGSRQVSFWG